MFTNFSKDKSHRQVFQGRLCTQPIPFLKKSESLTDYEQLWVNILVSVSITCISVGSADSQHRPTGFFIVACTCTCINGGTAVHLKLTFRAPPPRHLNPLWRRRQTVEHFPLGWGSQSSVSRCRILHLLQVSHPFNLPKENVIRSNHLFPSKPNPLVAMCNYTTCIMDYACITVDPLCKFTRFWLIFVYVYINYSP